MTLVALVRKEKADSDRAIGEEIRRKACEKLGETSKRNAGEKAEPVAKKSRRSGSETLDFLREKMGARQAETERQAKMQQELLTMMQNQNAAILQILNKMADKQLNNPFIYIDSCLLHHSCSGYKLSFDQLILF